MRYNLTLAIIYQTAFSLESHNKPTNACRLYMNDSFKGIISFFFLFLLFIQKPRWPLKFHKKKIFLSMFSFSSKLYIYLVITKKLLCGKFSAMRILSCFWYEWAGEPGVVTCIIICIRQPMNINKLFISLAMCSCCFYFFYVLSQRNIWPWTLTTRNKIVFFQLKIHQFDAISH